MSSLVSVKGGWPSFTFVSVINGEQKQETTSIYVYNYKQSFVLIASESFGRSFSHALAKAGGSFNSGFKEFPQGWLLPHQPVGFPVHGQDGKVPGWYFPKKTENALTATLSSIVAGQIVAQQATSFKTPVNTSTQQFQITSSSQLPFNIIPANSTLTNFSTAVSTPQIVVQGIPTESKVNEVTSSLTEMKIVEPPKESYTLVIENDNADSYSYLIPNSEMILERFKVLDSVSITGRDNSDEETNKLLDVMLAEMRKYQISGSSIKDTNISTVYYISN